ncbi:MAG: nucleotidyl transferase AbiEii/AbiGii toxin family protein [Candidatus Woesearchaeota archaeon]
MYPDKETKISYAYLGEVIRHLDKPICLLGGWAVYFTANTLFKKEKGYPYLGSRDIDLGFNRVETMKKAVAKLVGIGFRKLSFRLFKEIHSETMKELDRKEAKNLPQHYIFPMYVDLIIAKTEPSIRRKLGFVPVDEPLLGFVFGNENYRREAKEFGKKLIMPIPSLLLAMKISSIKGRDQEHKRIKDLCDLAALCLYSGIAIEELKKELAVFVAADLIKSNLSIISKSDISEAARILALEEGIVSGLVDRLKGR